MLDPRAQTLLKTLVERYIADGLPVGSRTLVQAFRARPVAGDDPQRHGRPRGARADRQPAHVVGASADAARLSAVRRHAADRRADAGRADARDPGPPAGRRAAAPAVGGGLAAVEPVAFRRCGDDPAARVAVPAGRVPAPVRAAHPADHRHHRGRRPEPRAVDRPRLHAFAAGRGGQLHQRALRRARFRAHPPAPADRAARRCATTSPR